MRQVNKNPINSEYEIPQKDIQKSSKKPLLNTPNLFQFIDFGPWHDSAQELLGARAGASYTSPKVVRL